MKSPAEDPHRGIVTRFAPSPTGLLHAGHAFSAVLGARLAHQSAGRWLLRIEDIDRSRCRPPFIDAIADDLRWLGLDFDRPALLQSTRAKAHAEALAELQNLGVTYPCFCTRRDIAEAASAPHGSDGRYPGSCRALDATIAARRAEHEPHAIRLDVSKTLALTGELTREEGNTTLPADPRPAGDVVLARKDIGVSYMLASVVDDAFQQVTDILRGRDLMALTATQRLLRALLGYPPIRHHHHCLMLGHDGRRLAKRDRSLTLAQMRQDGVDGKALASWLAGIATGGPDYRLPVDFPAAFRRHGC